MYPRIHIDNHTERRPKKRSWLLHGLNFALHLILILSHVLILLIWVTRLEHKVVIPIGKESNLVSTVIVQVSQIIITVRHSISRLVRAYIPAGVSGGDDLS